MPDKISTELQERRQELEKAFNEAQAQITHWTQKQYELRGAYSEVEHQIKRQSGKSKKKDDK